MRRNNDGSITVTTRRRWADAVTEAIRRKQICDQKFPRPDPTFWRFKVQRVHSGRPWVMTWGVTFKDPTR